MKPTYTTPKLHSMWVKFYNIQGTLGLNEGILTSMVSRLISTGGFNARNAHIPSPARGFRQNSLPNDNMNVQYINHFTIILYSLDASVERLLLLKTRRYKIMSLGAHWKWDRGVGCWAACQNRHHTVPALWKEQGLWGGLVTTWASIPHIAHPLCYPTCPLPLWLCMRKAVLSLHYVLSSPSTFFAQK